MVTDQARRCRCGKLVNIRRVWLHGTAIDVGACGECDRRRCGKCRQTTGAIFVAGIFRCEHCGSSS